MDIAKLHAWFLEHRRPLPWREDPTPYAVWISEVMLQQTRAEVVGPYFERWMRLFPSIQALAEAPLEKVIKAWEGLGYYSRARNLHVAAQQIFREHGGQIPSTEEELRGLPGLGPYTTGAVLSFGFHQRAAAVDGNVLRVISRYASLAQCVDLPKTQREITQIVEDLLDQEAPWITMEALIELGATVCTQRPACEKCPLEASCKAKEYGKINELPVKRKMPRIEKIFRSVALIEADGWVLVRKNSSKLMQDLTEFPYFEGRLSSKKLQAEVEQLVAQRVETLDEMAPVQHGFTRFHATLFATRFHCLSPKEIADGKWVRKELLSELPFSAGHRQLLHAFLQEGP